MLNALLQQMGQLTAAMLAQQNQQAIPAAAGFAAEQPPGFSGGGKGGGSRQARVEARHVKIGTFDGAPDKWDDWSFAFRRTIRSMSNEAYQMMTNVEKKSAEINEHDELDMGQEQVSGELYDVLCQFCTSEALTVIKGVDDMEGIAAWQRLHKKYNPKTMARAIRLLCDVVSPNKVKELHNIESDVNKWEEKIKMLDTQLGGKISNGMKIAIFANMMPGVIQDYIYSYVERDTVFDMLKQKVKALVDNKITMSSGATPMDIGRVENDDEHMNDEDFQDFQDDAVSMNIQ